MSSASHVSVAAGRAPHGLIDVFRLTPVWASLAITMMCVAVLFSAVFGPDFVTSSAGGSTTRIPSGIAVALFAFLGTGAVAKYGSSGSDKS